MRDIEFEPSGLASLQVIQRVVEQVEPAADAVEAYLGEAVPPLTVTVAGRAGLATAQLRAAGWRAARLRDAISYWRIARQQNFGAVAVTSVTRTERMLIGLNSTALAPDLDEVWPTLIHEITHAVQMARPGRRAELRAGLDNNLRIADSPQCLREAMDAITAVEEAEAYTVQHALHPNGEQAPFDRVAVHRRLLTAVNHWAVADQPAIKV
jgi:hypothetical protein